MTLQQRSTCPGSALYHPQVEEVNLRVLDRFLQDDVVQLRGYVRVLLKELRQLGRFLNPAFQLPTPPLEEMAKPQLEQLARDLATPTYRQIGLGCPGCSACEETE